MYLTGLSPYLDGSLLRSESQNTIRVNLLGIYSTVEPVMFIVYRRYLTYIPSQLTGLP